MGDTAGKAALVLAGAGGRTALDAADVRESDGQFAAIDLNGKAGTFYAGRLRGTLPAALRDAGGAYQRASTAQHLDTNRLLATAALDVPATLLSLTPAVTVRGVAFERTSFNALPISTGAGFGNSTSNAATALSPIKGPDGVFSLLRFTSTVNGGFVQQTGLPLPADGSVYCFSFLVPKTAVLTGNTQVAALSSGGSVFTAYVNIAAGDGITLTAGNGGTTDDFGTIDQGEFWLIWFSKSINTNTAVTLRITPALSATGSADLGWFQMEPGTSPTSRIRTTGTALLRRERDVATIPVPALTAGGTIEVIAAPAGGATTRVLAQVDDGTAANRVTVQRTPAGNIQALWVSGGATIATLDLGAHIARAETRVAIGWSGTTLRAVRDGAGLLTAALAPPAGLKVLRLGGDTAATSLDGPVARVSAWPGLRTDVFYEAPTAGFLIAGDSMTGAGVSSDNDRWPFIMTANLKRPTLVNQGVGGTTSSQMLTAYLTTPTVWNRTLLIYTGHNAPNAAQTIADIQAMIATMTGDPLKKRFLIGIPVMHRLTAPGSAGWTAIMDTRAAIKANWPDNFVDVPAGLLAAQPADADAIAGYSPSAYRADDIHLNAAGQLVEETLWRARALAKGY